MRLDHHSPDKILYVHDHPLFHSSGLNMSDARLPTNTSDKHSPALHLANSEAQVWSTTLRRAPQAVAGLAALLSPDETARAKRFYFERDRNRYIVGRGLLRTLLGRYLGMEPARVEFNYGPHGKPALKTNNHSPALEFNLAHSNDRALYIFCRDRQVGIDLEYIRPMEDEDALARYVFSPDEIALVASLSGQEKHNAFFKIWTCKEAVLKASGDGLSKPLDQTDIAIAAESARLVSIDGDREQAAAWRLETWQPAPDYQAALAFKPGNCQIAFFQTDDDLLANNHPNPDKPEKKNL